MIIENKKTGIKETVSKDLWLEMGRLDIARNFLIISNEDTMKLGKVKVPVEIMEFMGKTKAEIQKDLDSRGVEYKKSDSKKKLVERYDDGEGDITTGIDEAVQ